MHEIARIMPVGRIFWFRFMIFLAAQVLGTNVLMALFRCALFPVPTESCALLFGRFFEQVQAAPAIVMRASGEDRIEQAHGCSIRSPKGRRFHRSDEAFMGKAGDWRNQCIRYSHTIGSVTPRLPQAFHRKPQAAPTADHDNHAASASGPR